MLKSAKSRVKPNAQIGVLLVNLGTPQSADPRAVKRYLLEFLTDKRVLPLPWIMRQLLVRIVIVPRRYRTSADLYKSIWTPQGSPLLVHGYTLAAALQRSLGSAFFVQLAMRYQSPSIATAMQSFQELGLQSLIIIPLFPQSSTATTSSVRDTVHKFSRSFQRVRFIESYPTNRGLIAAFCSRAAQFSLPSYDHILFSYHGLPKKFLRKNSPLSHCLEKPTCCSKLTEMNRHCYAAQCVATTKALTQKLHLDASQITHCYQSRLGRAAWLRPYTSDVIVHAAQEGKKRLLIFCPSFVADCLETLSEIKREYHALFFGKWGRKLGPCRSAQ